MRKTGNGIIASVLAMTLLAGCSGVVMHGFDEESALYTKPASEKEIKKAKEIPERSEKEVKEVDEVLNAGTKAQAPDEENETVISYDPNEGE
ncbi:hypothetical protein [Sulfurimonas sp. HSL3-7]|uniref:hypothetical protein n=1 Tax=Sulfonitrofixus jiaomeiensis TaxID=3131938 RepID=UPI0031F7E879